MSTKTKERRPPDEAKKENRAEPWTKYKDAAKSAPYLQPQKLLGGFLYANEHTRRGKPEGKEPIDMYPDSNSYLTDPTKAGVLN